MGGIRSVRRAGVGRLLALSLLPVGLVLTHSAAAELGQSDVDRVAPGNGAAPNPPPKTFPFMGDVAPARSGVTAWFGLRPPGPETDSARGVVDTADVDLPARP